MNLTSPLFVWIRRAALASLFVWSACPALGADVSIATGWNLVGNNTGSAIIPSTVFGTRSVPVAGVSSQVSSVWAWDSTTLNWQFYSPSMDATELASFAQSKGYSVISSIPDGRGFWINSRAALTVPLASPSTATTYTAAALVGELVTYTIDPIKLTYSYTVAESQYGLTGKTGSGTLARNSDGTYSPSGMSNARFYILPNGIMLGAIRESFGGTTKTVPVYGFSNPVSTLEQGQGTYNYVQYSCYYSSCGTGYGTFSISADGVWTSCPSGNLATGCTGVMNSGTLSSIGNGKWLVMDGSTNIGTAFMFASGGQTVMILDLKDTRSPGYGVGTLIGSTEQAVTSSKTDGKWLALTSNGHSAIFTITGSNISYLSVDGAPVNQTTAMTLNLPWSGIVKSASGGYGILAGIGFYAYENSIGGAYAELGIKIQ